MPNSFYRFQPAWNAGFYPDNQITSNLLNELATTVDAWLPVFFPGKTLSQLVAGVTGQMDSFNVSPYFGGFTLTYQEIFDTPNYEYNINIRNADLSETDNGQVLTINGFFNFTTKDVLNANVIAFTPGSYSGTFDYSPIPVESEVNRALKIVEQNGSAFFPLTYSFDSGSNIATSGLARGKNWQLDSSGNSTRLPADTLPKQNARTFSVAPQTAEDRYCISLMEKVIQFSFTNTVAIEVRDYFNSFTIPDGWTRGASIVAGTYERIYLNLYRDDRSLLMIGRLDTTWLWQRFLDDSGTNDVNYFIDYSSTTPLPYLPLSSYQWLYNDWYDMEFVEFNSGCYESPEFYAMPAIPGDNWQFNVPSDSGNLTGLSTASVGLFSQDGQFIQQVGEADLAVVTLTEYGMYANFGVRGTYQDWFDAVYNPVYTVNFQATDCNGDLIGDILATIPENGITTDDFNEFKSVVEGLSFPDWLSVVVELDDTGRVEFYFTFTNAPVCFCSITAWTYYEGSGETLYFIKPFIFENQGRPTQFQATTLIPAVATGCYRLGLYAESEGGFYLYSLSNIINIDGSDCFSTMLEFWANDNSIAQGFEYFNDWKQRVRLGLNGGGAKPVIEENLYRQSNGVHRRPQNKQDLSLDLHSDFIDPETQLALVDATRHPYLVWDNKSIFVKGDIDVATIQDFTTQSSFETLAQVKFSALVQGFQPKNSSCLAC
jgi:hypothetical protein